MAKGNGSTRVSLPAKSAIIFPEYAISDFGGTQIGGPAVEKILTEQLHDATEDIAEAKKLLDKHSLGDAQQGAIDEEIYELINDKSSPVGKVLRDMARINTEQYKRQMERNRANIEKNVEKDFTMERMYTTSDISDAEVRQRLREKYERTTEVRIYRGGSRKNTESWTTDARGANTGSGRIAIDHRSTIGELLKTHYMVAGISQMVGAPGEAEILFVRKRK